MKRNSFLDCVRGLGMVLVVFGHAQRGLHDGNLFPASYPFEQIDFTLYTFHMPLFFLLAGLHVWPSVEKGSRRFLRSKFLTIVVPYFVWSIIQGGVQILMAGSTNHPLSLSDWPMLFYRPLGQFWFLYALMIWQLIALCYGRFRPALIVVAVTAFLLGSAIPESFFATAMKMGIFFAAGTLVGPELEARIERFAHAGFPVSCTLAFLLSTYMVMGVAPFYSFEAIPAAIFGIALTLIVCYWLNRSWAATPLAICGRRSMPIYVLHIMAVSGMRIVLLKAGIRNPYLMLPVCTIAGVLLPLGVSPILARIGDALSDVAALVHRRQPAK
ncbi:acyltransferase family protein [Paraburkholderia bryophila]|uniref:Fucose 4-O-acetylase-like acetyltransferase n=1 Tax=Paraburkholderia bryophila TaxID=420952 RepID=A0A7Y9W682_9BURK|nr:fucose 4-O-acetylase-like acetyltransferase [Paraburkholderia bryophila]